MMRNVQSSAVSRCPHPQRTMPSRMPSIQAVILGDAISIDDSQPIICDENPLEQQRYNTPKQINAQKPEFQNSSSQSSSSLTSSSSSFFRNINWNSFNWHSKTNEPTHTVVVREEHTYTLTCTVVRPRKYPGVFSIFNKLRWDASRELVDEFPVFGDSWVNGMSVNKDVDARIHPEDDK